MIDRDFGDIKKQFYQHKISWINSFYKGLSVDENSNFIPWYCYEAINFLTNNLPKNISIFEFGCGSSTLFYLQKGCNIISLETNKIWFDLVIKLINQQIKSDFKIIHQDNFYKNQNIEIYLMEDGLTNDKYENFCQDISLKKQILFDYIVIDSLKRYLSCKNSLQVLKPFGTIILDDSQRKNYHKIFELMKEKNFMVKNFTSISPAQLKIKTTSFFSKNFC